MLPRRSLKAGALAAALLVTAALPLRSAEDKAEGAKKKPATVAHIRLAGGLEEGPAALDPIFGGDESFKAKLDRFQKAQDDKNVAALYVEVDGLHVGWAKVQELRAAIAAF